MHFGISVQIEHPIMTFKLKKNYAALKLQVKHEILEYTCTIQVTPRRKSRVKYHLISVRWIYS